MAISETTIVHSPESFRTERTHAGVTQADIDSAIAALDNIIALSKNPRLNSSELGDITATMYHYVRKLESRKSEQGTVTYKGMI